MKRIVSALLCGLLVIGCTACSETGYVPEEPTPTEEEVTEEPTTEQPTLSSEDIEGLLSQTTPAAPTPSVDPEEVIPEAEQGELGNSVWLAKADMDESERFFFFYDNGNGTYLEQETGTGMGFTYEMTEDGDAVFHIGDITSVTNANLWWLDADHMQINWEDGSLETLTRMPNDPREPFHFYSSEVLRERAMNVFEQKNGFRPITSSSWANYDGMISIQLVDKIDDHEYTCDWYTVDRYTGIGTNLLGERINLSDTPDAETTAPTEATLPTDAAGMTEASSEIAETTETPTTTIAENGYRRR